MHQRADGRVVWQWHACVACARTTGRIAPHARFGTNGQPTECPIAEHANDRLYEILPSEASKNDVAGPVALQHKYQSANNRLRFQEQCIKNYEKQRDELMSALGAALMRLNSVQASYPHWVWESYERGRLERQTYFATA